MVGGRHRTGLEMAAGKTSYKCAVYLCSTLILYIQIEVIHVLYTASQGYFLRVGFSEHSKRGGVITSSSFCAFQNINVPFSRTSSFTSSVV